MTVEEKGMKKILFFILLMTMGVCMTSCVHKRVDPVPVKKKVVPLVRPKPQVLLPQKVGVSEKKTGGFKSCCFGDKQNCFSRCRYNSVNLGYATSSRATCEREDNFLYE